YMLTRSGFVSEIALCHAHHCGVDLDAVNFSVRKDLTQGDRQGRTPKPNDQHRMRIGFCEQRTGHHARVLEHHRVWLMQLEAALAALGFDGNEVHATLTVLLENHDWCKVRRLCM